MDDGLRIDGLRVRLGGRRILDGASLHAPRGEATALLGLNGAGKTTLLRAAMGLLPAEGGRCTVDGAPLRGLSPKERARLAAYVPQRLAIDGGLTALDAVLMGANARTPLLRGYARAERERALSCLAQLGAGALAPRAMGGLSEGERRLVALARALLQSPAALLLDEPDGALDLPRRYAVLGEIVSLARTGRAALVSLHDASLALSLCDRAAILTGGRIACTLDLRSASRGELEDAMDALYGGARVLGGPGAWSVQPRGGALHPSAHPV